MKPEKMTDEQVSVALSRLEAQWPLHSAGLRAHVAALEAERDKAEMVDECRAHMRTQEEARALRERVQALERERIVGLACLGDAANTMFKTAEQAANYLKRVVSDLAAIRQRAGDTETACEVMHDAYEGAAKREGWETQKRSRKPWLDVPAANKATMRVAVAALARYIVGDAPEAGRCVNQQSRSPESEHHLVQIVRSTEATVRAVSAAQEAVQTAPSPPLPEYEVDGSRALASSSIEPTTAEAFATVRRGLCEDSRGADAEAALSLLERRMGAMAQALRNAVEWMRKDGGAKTGGEPCRHSGGCKWQRAEAVLLAAEFALTDAPPVFTLGEVEKAVLTAWRTAGSSLTVEELTSAVCAALRR